MADYPGSRAIKIPIQSHRSNDYVPSQRRQRGSRYVKSISTADSLEAGPSSSVSSEAESSWSSSFPTQATHQAQTSIAPPSVKDPHLLEYIVGDESKRKDKQKATSPATPSASPPSSVFQSSSPLGPSMQSSSSYKSINLNAHHDDPHEPPRLITYTKHSQGFTWNDELFLPSYLIGRGGGRRKQYDADFGDDEDGCQVAEIFVTDEEAEAMLKI